MDREKKNDAVENNEEEYALKGNNKLNVISYIVCVLAAIIIWLLIMNLGEPTNIPLSAEADSGWLEKLLSTGSLL
jgi:hypothetical protein